MGSGRGRKRSSGGLGGQQEGIRCLRGHEGGGVAEIKQMVGGMQGVIFTPGKEQNKTKKTPILSHCDLQ